MKHDGFLFWVIKGYIIFKNFLISFIKPRGLRLSQSPSQHPNIVLSYMKQTFLAHAGPGN